MERDRDWVRISELRCSPRLSPESSLEFWRVHGGRRLSATGGGTDLAAGPQALGITANSFSARTPASPGITCNYGRKSTKRVLKFRGSVTRTRSPIILKRNINLRRSFSVRCAGTSRSLDPSTMGERAQRPLGSGSWAHRRCDWIPFHLAHPAQAAIQLSTRKRPARVTTTTCWLRSSPSASKIEQSREK